VSEFVKTVEPTRSDPNFGKGVYLVKTSGIGCPVLRAQLFVSKDEIEMGQKFGSEFWRRKREQVKEMFYQGTQRKLKGGGE